MLKHFLSSVRRWCLTSLITPYILTVKTINKSGKADTEEMLNTDQDAYVMHFFGHEETAERLLHILKHEDCHSYINDDDNMATFEYKWKIADGI